MTTLHFPDPNLQTTYIAPNGVTYLWDSEKWIASPPSSGIENWADRAGGARDGCGDAESFLRLRQSKARPDARRRTEMPGPLRTRRGHAGGHWQGSGLPAETGHRPHGRAAG